ncbi:MAG: ChaN family lipoprotein, partial [Myxococcaceae bacterium]
MRGSLSLQLSLFRRQQTQISEAVEGASRTFKAYEARYRRRTAGPGRVIRRSDVGESVRDSDIVYVGDYHTLRLSQRTYLELVQDSLKDDRRTVLAVEFVEGRHQALLDAYLRGHLSERAFLGRIGHGASTAYDLWTGFKPVLTFAKEHGLDVVAIDKRATGERSLMIRDGYAAQRIAEAASAKDRPRVMVLMGQFHVAPCHLPAHVESELGEMRRKSLVVYQNCDGVWWSLARRGKLEGVDAVRLREGELCLLRASPVVCQQSFLDYLEAERGDEPLGGRSATERFRELARLIARFVGADVRDGIDDVCVATASDPDFLDEVQTRGGLNRSELSQLRRQILSRESYYIPRARMAYLASLSLNHAAEEAAHFVRHMCVGDSMDAPRRPADAFYA